MKVWLHLYSQFNKNFGKINWDLTFKESAASDNVLGTFLRDSNQKYENTKESTGKQEIHPIFDHVFTFITIRLVSQR